MAAQTAVNGQHATLSGSTADSVTFSATGCKAVRVTNKDTSNVMYFNANTATVPVALADEVYYVAPGTSVTVVYKGDVNVVRVVGNGNAYSVEIFPVSAQTSGAGSAAGGGAVTNAGVFAVQETGTWVQVDDAAFTPAVSKIIMAGLQADETATDSVDEGDGGAARMTLDRKAIVNPQPHTAGGLSTFAASAQDGSTALTSTAQAAKASAGNLYGFYIYNPNAVASWVVFYDTAQGGVTVGTTNPLFVVAVPPTGAVVCSPGTMGIAFATAITVAATTTAGGAGTPTTALDTVFWYK